MPDAINILLVEDNPGDVELTREALAQGKILNILSVVPDGVEALRFLKREGPYGDATPPDLILLDLNLPRMNGHEVLQELKTSPRFRRIPVVVLTSSSEERDIVASYEKHANCYITKPVDLDQFMEVVRQIENFWVKIVTLPSDEA